MERPPTAFEVDGAAICKNRMQAGFEVQQLADLVGITGNYLRKLERGTRKHLRPGKYVRLKAALNSTDDELLVPHRGNPERK
ncbi:helix-turn-helix domain-containing protein [Streptomyces lasiicapitis]|uniref:helix-turn-helix domain-containing protein n=1 Tax=Streptomyces lasiicapitis TaxID=1923961 RepID=UPI0036914803